MGRLRRRLSPVRGADAQAHDVPAQELDWLVCNSGADIWHATAAGDAGGVAWSADERWEHHIDFRRAPRPAPRRGADAADQAPCTVVCRALCSVTFDSFV
jgi:hypothetical protein